jgi:hypothetical protein
MDHLLTIWFNRILQILPYSLTPNHFMSISEKYFFGTAKSPESNVVNTESNSIHFLADLFSLSSELTTFSE